MTNFSGTFYTPKQDQGPNFRKTMAIIHWILVKNQTLCFFWMQNRPNLGVCIVHTVSNIFALVMEKR